MAHTDALGNLLQQLHTDTNLQEAFKSNPANAVEAFDLTHHEEDAVVSRDLDDLVAVGAVGAIADLPEVLRGDHREEEPDLPRHLLDRLERIEANILHLFEHTTPQPKVPPVPPGPWQSGGQR
ncbi:MAG TPA: hypothetical protein VF715_03085 [Thermoleophilaceae bacterium]|jgi:hypothetical protein